MTWELFMSSGMYHLEGRQLRSVSWDNCASDMVGVPHVLCFLMSVQHGLLPLSFTYLQFFASTSGAVRNICCISVSVIGIFRMDFASTVTSHSAEIIFSSHSYSQYYKSAYVLFFVLNFSCEFRRGLSVLLLFFFF